MNVPHKSGKIPQALLRIDSGTILRLPPTLTATFERWLEQNFPEKGAKVSGRIMR
jgi:hypothetical protein